MFDFLLQSNKVTHILNNVIKKIVTIESSFSFEHNYHAQLVMVKYSSSAAKGPSEKNKTLPRIALRH